MLGMGVERQVVGGEGDVVLEQRAQPLGQRGRQPGGLEVPEQPVVDEHEPGRQGAARSNSSRWAETPVTTFATLSRPGHLQPVRPVVLERAGIEQLVEVRDQRS